VALKRAPPLSRIPPKGLQLRAEYQLKMGFESASFSFIPKSQASRYEPPCGSGPCVSVRFGVVVLWRRRRSSARWKIPGFRD
jgi:hypothetical protein